MSIDKGRIYPIQYYVGPWNKPIAEETVEVAPGVRIIPSNLGYADQLFVASIILDEDGSIESILLLDSTGEDGPSPDLLRAVRDQIDHHLEHHV